MSKTFNHLFDAINMPTQIYHTCLGAGKNVLVKEEQGIPFFHHEDTVDVDTSFQQCETRQRIRPKSKGMWEISNIPVSNQYYCF